MLFVAVLLLFAAPGVTVPQAMAEAAPECFLTWNVVRSPNVGNSEDGLDAVAVLDAMNVWAVGSFTLLESGAA